MAIHLHILMVSIPVDVKEPQKFEPQGSKEQQEYDHFVWC